MNDFDFLVGSWHVHNRRLTARLARGGDWEEFPATSECLRLFDGAANADWITFHTKQSNGLTLRLFDPERKEWSLYWASSRDGILQPPVVGGFSAGTGAFYGDDTHDGRPIRVRFLWSDITATSARWEQAFSADGERTWETNWIMCLTRR